MANGHCGPSAVVSRRTTDALVFALAGAGTFLVLGWIDWHWLSIAARLTGRPHIVFDQQPPWVRGLHSAIGALPWIIGALLLVVAIVKKRWIPLVAFAGAQVLGVCILLGVIFAMPALKDYAAREQFDPVGWKAENTHSAKGIRVHMVDDLLRKHALVGMSQGQLEALLGVPPSSEYFQEYDYVYWLGQERGPFAIDSEWLVVKLENGSVAKARVVTD